MSRGNKERFEELKHKKMSLKERVESAQQRTSIYKDNLNEVKEQLETTTKEREEAEQMNKEVKVWQGKWRSKRDIRKSLRCQLRDWRGFLQKRNYNSLVQIRMHCANTAHCLKTNYALTSLFRDYFL